MSRWLVQQGDHQFATQDLDELKRLASAGKLTKTDMVQPPGAADWLYANEVPQLKGLISGTVSTGDFEDEPLPSKSPLPLVVVFVLLILAGGYGAWYYASKLPKDGDLELIGENGLQLTEVLVTEPNAPLMDKPGGTSKGILDKDKPLALLGKRGDWYNVRTAGGNDGFVRMDHVVPAYFFTDADTRLDVDPIYNPDNYISVKNASWLQLDKRNRNLTIFQFMIHNQSNFVMTDLILLATIKDKTGKELERVEIPIEGQIPRHEAVMVGTLQPETDEEDPVMMTTSHFEEIVEDDPDLNLRWSDGVEVEMQTSGFTEANIDILQVRAVPND